jgi:hypothetical protein
LSERDRQTDIDWYVAKKRTMEPTARDSLQYINQGRGMRNYFTRNEKKYIEIFSKKQDENGI